MRARYPGPEQEQDTTSRRCALLQLIAVAMVLPTSAALASGDLEARLAKVLRRSEFREAQVSVLVVRLSDGAVLFQRSPALPLAPASNMKILTALAALAEFGPAHRFETVVSADRDPVTSGAVGTLAVRGSGDPSLTIEEWWRLVGDLRRAGVREIREGVILDDSVFDRTYRHPGWYRVGVRAYHAPIAGLSVNYNTFAVEVRGGRVPGSPAWVAIDPETPYFTLDNRARTGAAEQATSLRIERLPEAEAERIIVSGIVPAGRPREVYYRAVTDVPKYVGAVLRAMLESNGIRVAGSIRSGVAPTDWRELLRFEGKSVGEDVRLMMKYSNNFIAESLVKAMAVHRFGGPGTWELGIEAMRDRLEALHLDLSGARLVDGSGLARENRVTARLLVDALRTAWASFEFGPEFVAALPIAGRDGTLRNRARHTLGVVRAKSGHLSTVTSLSGYARMHDGTDAVFSVLVNTGGQATADIARAVDAFVSELVAGKEKPSEPTF